jgi:hypothetical protein
MGVRISPCQQCYGGGPTAESPRTGAMEGPAVTETPLEAAYGLAPVEGSNPSPSASAPQLTWWVRPVL